MCIKESSYIMASSTKEDVLHGMTESPDHVSALPGMRRVRGWEVCGHDLIAISTHLHAATWHSYIVYLPVAKETKSTLWLKMLSGVSNLEQWIFWLYMHMHMHMYCLHSILYRKVSSTLDLHYCVYFGQWNLSTMHAHADLLFA